MGKKKSIQSFLKIGSTGVNNFFFSLLLLLLLVIPGRAAEVITAISESETAKYQANLGAYYWQKGNWHQAIEAWSKEAKIYRSQGLAEQEAEAILKISQGYVSLGQLRLAIFYLEKLLSSIKEPSLTARAWEQLGNAHSRSGLLEEATLAYNKSLEIEESLSTLNNLVILFQKKVLHAELQADSSREGDETEEYRYKAESYAVEAVRYAKQALALSESEESLSSLRALIEWGSVSPAGLSAEELDRGRKLLGSLSSSRTKAFLTIKWAKLDSEQVNYWFSQAQEIAEHLGDEFAESYALLELGRMAEKSGNLEQALDYAQAAQLKAQSLFAYRSLYQSHWLAGRIYRQNGNKEAAIANYREAIASLDAFSQGFTKISVERRLDVVTKIEPIYRELLELLLDDSNPAESNLTESLLIFDKLRLVQLQSYFGDNCLEIERKSRSVKDLLASKKAVLINSIVLAHQTHFILQLPDGTLRHSKAELVKAGITEMATDWYKSINSKKSLNWQQFTSQGQNLYNLIVRPFEKELEQINPDTIIFVHDGVLRNLPMAALHDGSKFLAQKWASVSSIGLNFQSTANSEKKLKKREAVAFGLGVDRDGWSELDKVDEEIEEVVNTLGGKKILDRDFTTENLFKELNRAKYSVVHLATHAYFGGVAENSYILAYDKSVSALELEKLFSQSQEQIELLVFSACETAISSERSALGLAGVALRSGVSSVLGSFWQVQDDKQLELMKAFYSNLQAPNLGLAQALQQVQIEQIQQREHPSEWAALNLIENL